MLDAEYLDTVIEGYMEDVLPQLDDNSVQLVVTSPPYFSAKPEYASYPTYGAYLAHMQSWLSAIYRVLEPGRRLVWVIDDLLKSKEFVNCTTSQDSVVLAKLAGFIVKTKIIWYDPMNAEGWLPGTYPNGPSVVINWCAEDVWVFQKPDTWKSHHPRYKELPPELAKYDVMDKDFLIRYAREQVWRIRSVHEYETGHPAAFPEELVEPIIRMWSRPGELVLDPFCGSGTTLASALKWRRRFLGIDRKPDYVKLSRRNVERRKMELLAEEMQQSFLPKPPETVGVSALQFLQQEMELP